MYTMRICKWIVGNSKPIKTEVHSETLGGLVDLAKKEIANRDFYVDNWFIYKGRFELTYDNTNQLIRNAYNEMIKWWTNRNEQL